MGKAARRKALEPRIRREPWAEPPSWAAPLLAVAAVAGIVLGAVSTWVHHQVSSSDGAYTSFCNVSEAVNCDTVVSSPHGALFGIPVALLATGFYAVLLAVALRARSADPEARDAARADALALAGFGAAFSLYLAMISVFVLKTVCLLCAGLYVVAAAALVAAVALGKPVAQSTARWRDRWRAFTRRPGLAAGAAVLVVAVLAASSWLSASTRLTREQVFRANPRFYDWYTALPIVDVSTEGGISQGPENAPIQLVEFSDFECPHCAQAYVTLKDVLPRFQDQVRLVFHHFPLSNRCNETMKSAGHAHACDAAVAAQCAADQKRFSPLATQLFANQTALDPASLRGHAEEAGLDLAAYDACIAGAKAKAAVAADVESGKRLNVRSTPTFFVNGRKVEGNMTFENWLLAFYVELDKR